MLTYNFQIYKDTCNTAYGINPLYFTSILVFTWKLGSKMTEVELENITDDKFILTPENIMRGGPAINKGTGHVKWRERKKYIRWY